MISYKYRCIYVRIPKNASTSIRNYFGNFLGGHPMQAYLDQSYIADHLDRLPRCINMFPTYFTFTFVRNPFDKFVSSWVQRFNPNGGAYKNNPVMRNHSLREYAELIKDLLIHRSSASCPSDKEMGPHRAPFCNLHYERTHLLCQKDFLLDYNPEYFLGVKRCNSAPCSFIGRYENLEKDFSCLLDILGAPNHKLPKVKSRRIREGRHYSDYYDKSTRQLVEEIYADDLNLLGYDFEEAGKLSVLNPLYDENIARSRRADSMKLSVIGIFKCLYPYFKKRQRIILLAGLFKGRAIFIRRAFLAFFIYPILTFFGLYDICRHGHDHRRKAYKQCIPGRV